MIFFFLSQERNTRVGSFKIASIFGPISIDSDRFMIVGESSSCETESQVLVWALILGWDSGISPALSGSHVWRILSTVHCSFPTNQLPPSAAAREKNKKIFIFISFFQFLSPKNKSQAVCFMIGSRSGFALVDFIFTLFQVILPIYHYGLLNNSIILPCAHLDIQKTRACISADNHNIVIFAVSSSEERQPYGPKTFDQYGYNNYQV